MPLTQVRGGGIANDAVTSAHIVAGAIEDSDISNSATILGETASDTNIAANRTVAANKNSMMVGDIQVNDGVTLTISSGSKLIIMK